MTRVQIFPLFLFFFFNCVLVSRFIFVFRHISSLLCPFFFSLSLLQSFLFLFFPVVVLFLRFFLFSSLFSLLCSPVRFLFSFFSFSQFSLLLNFSSCHNSPFLFSTFYSSCLSYSFYRNSFPFKLQFLLQLSS